MNKIKPSHYKAGKGDVIDICLHHSLDFAQGNVVKYVVRYKNKNGIEDLRKAKEYLERLIEHEESIIENELEEEPNLLGNNADTIIIDDCYGGCN